MKLAVEFPSVAYREGPDGVRRLARAIEDIGYDQLEMFDHVVMGYPQPDRPTRYPAQMPIMEALMTLSHVAAVTNTIGLGTEVLVLPQRQPVLVAKQVATLDTLSGGRMRLGVGSGWQPSEFQMLGEEFADRGQRMDEAIRLIRACWRDDEVNHVGPHYRSDAMAMEPKPPQGEDLPIWIGGGAPAALRRVAQLGDGWLAPAMQDERQVRGALDTIARHMDGAQRNFERLGLQMMLTVPPSKPSEKGFYANVDNVVARAVQVQCWGFGCGALNATAIFQSGARSVDAMIDVLGTCFERIKQETG